MIELGTHDNSPLRYPGGKARRAVRLLRFVDHSCKNYIEPFGGGLGLLIRAKRERLFRNYYANDLDANLINFYTVLRDYPDELIEQLWACYRHHGAGDEELFYQSRENLASGNDIVRAVAYFVTNRWSVKGDLSAGMIRTSKRRNGISPMILNRLPIFSDLLNGVTLTNLDYQDVKIPRNAFSFLDPPYENVGASFYKHKVNLDEFAEWAKDLNCSWLTTLNDSEFTNTLFEDFDRVVEPVKYPVVINPLFGSFERRNITEIVVMNYRRPTRDAFMRQFGWSVRKAPLSSKAV